MLRLRREQVSPCRVRYRSPPATYRDLSQSELYEEELDRLKALGATIRHVRATFL